MRLLSFIAVAVLSPTLGFAADPITNRVQGPCKVAKSHAQLTEASEPGRPLKVKGKVFQPDGTTPAPGLIVYAYQTDNSGVYSKEQGSPPRIRGWLKTDQTGSFSFQTIVPGAYPGRSTAAHIHFHIWSENMEPQYAQDLLFAGDPLLTAEERNHPRERGQFGSIKRIEPGADGVGEASIAFRLKPSPDYFDPDALHGVSACTER